MLSRNQNVLSEHPEDTAEEGKKKKRKSKSAVVLKEAELSPGTSVVGLVEHKTPYFLVVSCSTLMGHRLAYGLINSVSLSISRPMWSP
jgi:hypothetical protein